jgi:D-proline reductase (dithiol) PrdB
MTNRGGRRADPGLSWAEIGDSRMVAAPARGAVYSLRPKGGIVANSEVDRSHRTFVSYIDRTRELYLAQGYENPYQWAYFDEVPFRRLPRALSQCRITLISTASPFREECTSEGGLPMAKEVSSGATDAPPDRLYTDDLAWDKETTHTDDLDSFFPIHRLHEFVHAGRIGSLAARYHGVPTEYSQRRTMEHDAPEILRRCREDEVDAALLVPL